MQYKLKKVHLTADSADELSFPALKDRVIEKYGAVVEFTLGDIEANKVKMLQLKQIVLTTCS